MAPGLVDVPSGHDVVVQVAYDVRDRPGNEHWRVVFRAGLGAGGATRGPRVLDITDRPHQIDSERGDLEQRLTLPPGTHDVGFTVEAYYSSEPWDEHILDERNQDARIDGSVGVSVAP